MTQRCVGRASWLPGSYLAQTCDNPGCQQTSTTRYKRKGYQSSPSRKVSEGKETRISWGSESGLPSRKSTPRCKGFQTPLPPSYFSNNHLQGHQFTTKLERGVNQWFEC